MFSSIKARFSSSKKPSVSPRLRLQPNEVALVSIGPSKHKDTWAGYFEVSRHYGFTVSEDNSAIRAADFYIAVAYSWDSASQFGWPVIVCDGSTVKINPGLSRAISMLAGYYPSKLFWIDGLSMDVETEFNMIGQMGRIFESAETTAIWLDQSTQRLYDNFDDAAQFISIRKQKNYVWTDLLVQLSEVECFRDCWILQQIRLAQKAVVIMGHKVMPWSELFEKVQLLISYISFGDLNTSQFIKSEYRSRGAAFNKKDFLDNRSRTIRYSFRDLASLASKGWHREASLMEDIIYFSLWMIQQDDEINNFQSKNRRAWNNRCIKTARICINSSSDLKILKIAGMRKRFVYEMTMRWDPDESEYLLNHPSWVPSFWKPPKQVESLVRSVVEERGCFAALNFWCPPKPPPQVVDDTSPFLLLKGVLLGVISTIHPGRTRIHCPPVCARAVPQEWLENTNPDTQPTIQGLHRVHMPDFIDNAQKHLYSDCSCIPYHRRSRDPFGINAWDREDTDDFKFDETSFSIDVNAVASSDNYSFAIEALIPTVDLPTMAESGDWLVLLEGGGTPFVLRPAVSRMRRALRPEMLMKPEEQTKWQITDDAGIFALVGEISMDWDKMWPGNWNSYCRAGNFVLI